MALTGLPFDDIRALFKIMPPGSQECREMVAERDAELVKPKGSLGRLEEIVAWLATWQGKSKPTMDRPQMVIFAGNHGVTDQGVARQPREATRQMMETYAAGGGAINQVCATYEMGLKVFDLALDLPTGDITQDAALDEKAAAATFAFGMEAIAGDVDLLCLGDVGVGGSTPAAAIFHALFGGTAAEWVGEDAALDAAGLARKVDAVARAVALHRDHVKDPLEVMRRLGGREICAMAGAIMAGRIERVPVILDGPASAAAAAILHAIDPTAIEHCLAGHASREGAHGQALARLGLAPLLNLGLGVGEGVGAALAAGVVKAAIACHRDMATYEQANIARLN